jgi:adenylate kinase family enzyme
MHPCGEAISNKLLIIGNSGSGKSTLSERIAAHTLQPIFDMDLIHWHEDGRKRDDHASRTMLAAVVGEPSWIVEGVYGWLAEIALPRATALIWTDLPWSECQTGLLHRGLRRGMTEVDQANLLAWAEAYRTRCTPSSAAGHERLFDAFGGEKLRLTSRKASDVFLARLADEFSN